MFISLVLRMSTPMQFATVPKANYTIQTCSLFILQ